MKDEPWSQSLKWCPTGKTVQTPALGKEGEGELHTDGKEGTDACGHEGVASREFQSLPVTGATGVFVGRGDSRVRGRTGGGWHMR